MEQNDEWSFLGDAVDWEDLLEDPMLPTLMEDSPLDMEVPTYLLSGQVSEKMMVEQLLADPQPPAAAFPPTGTAAAAGLQPGSSGESSWGTQPAGAYAQAKEEAGFSSGELRVNSYGAAPSVGTPPLYGAPLPLYDTHSGGSDYGPAAPQEVKQEAQPDALQHNILPARAAPCDEEAKAREAVLTMRQKNRVAQRRYRERKREQLQEVDARVADLQQQLRQMQLDKEELARRNALLERLAAMQQQQQRQAAKAAAAEPEDGLNSKRWWHDEHMKEYFSEWLHLEGPFVLTLRRDAPIYLTRLQACKMPLQEFRDMQAEYVNQYAACLLEMAGDPDAPAAKRLERLVLESGQLKMSIMLAYPDLLLSLHSLAKPPAPAGGPQQRGQLAAGGGGGGGQPTDAEWDKVLRHCMHQSAAYRSFDDHILASMQLTPLQLEAILALRSLFLRTTAALNHRRRQLAAVMQAAMPPGGDVSELTWSADAYGAHTLGAFAELQACIKDEHTTLLLFSMFVWRRVLTAVQTAHLGVTVYPHKPYVTKLAEAAARAAGSPSIAELMAQGGTAEEDAAVHPARFEAVLPHTLQTQTWQPPPEVDLAALYPNLKLAPWRGPDTPPEAAPPAPSTLRVEAVEAVGLVGLAPVPANAAPASQLPAFEPAGS